MAVFLLLSRLLLAAVLGVAGIAKLLDREGSRRALLDFGVPARLARQAAIMLPLVELGAAAALVPNASGRWGAIAALVLLGTFSVAIGAALVRGRRPSCHCFGRLHSAPAGWPTLLRNAGLGALAGAVVLLEPRAAVLTGSERLIVLGSAAVVAVVGAQAWLWFQLLRQNGRILVRLREVERASQGSANAVAAVGTPAPTFDLSTAAGGRLTLAGLLARGRPVLLVFGHSGCGPCQELLPQLARWQDERARELTVALVSEGTPAKSSPLRDVALQVGREVAEAYGVTATPAALLIDGEGLVASAVAIGSDAIGALVAKPAPASDEVAEPQDLRLALGLAAGGAMLASAGSAAAADRQSLGVAAVDDPELLGLRMVIKLANPRLVADSREVQRTLLALSRAKQKQASRAAARAALRNERAQLLALREALKAVPVSGERAVQAKQLATRSLSLLAIGLEHFGHAVASPRARESSRYLAQATKPLQQARSVASGANLVLGCTGKDC